jgi:hypothetical protein
MSYNPPVKRYGKDLGTPIPNVRFSLSERPRLNTHVASWLPLQLENERHDEYYVVLTGKVVSLDSEGFLCPAGFRHQLRLFRAAVVAAINGNLNASTAVPAAARYSAVDVRNGVVNSRGEPVREGEPVVMSMITVNGAPLVQYNAAAAGTSTAIPIADAAVVGVSHSIGHHIGVAPYSYLRSHSDVVSREESEDLFRGAATGKEARLGDSALQERHLSWRLQDRLTVLVSEESLTYPVVASRSSVALSGQAVAVGASLGAFERGARVTYDLNSDIVPANATTLSFLAPNMAGNDAADSLAVLESALEIRSYIVGQVLDQISTGNRTLLKHVKTRWESQVPGFEHLDRMPGSATGGQPHEVHTANSGVASPLGLVHISLLHK